MTDIQEFDSLNQNESSAVSMASLKQFVTFLVEGRTYGVDINTVREIKQWSPTTLLPNQSKYMRGVLNLRGTIIPVHDLKARFTDELTDATENHVVVIIWIGNKTVGVLVDAVSDIISISHDEIKSVPTEKRNSEPSIISGLVKNNKDMVAIIDTNVLFPNQTEDVKE